MTRALTLAGSVGATLMLGLFLLLTHPLVAMTNDHDGRSAFPSPGPADTRIVGAVRLGNQGLLPYTYQVRSQDPLPAGATLQIIRVEDGSALYTGHLGQQAVSLGELQPGKRATLKLVLTEPAGNTVAPTLIWSARGVLPDSSALLPYAAIAGLSALNLTLAFAWVREMRRGRRLGVRFP